MTDMIDLSTVVILNSPDVRTWPATADITAIVCSPDNTRFSFTKQSGPDAWPPQPFGDAAHGDNCQYTVWLFLQINGQWFGAGFIDMWEGRDGVGDAISDYVKNWMLPGRGWDSMVGHAIAPGETIGFMVSAGNARTGGVSSVQERSHIVTLQAPAGDVGTFTFGSAPAPMPVPSPAPPALDALEQLLPVLDAILEALGENIEATKALSARIEDIKNTGLKVHV